MSIRGPDSVPGYHLWHATLRWRAAVADALGPFDLTPTQFFVLGSLVHHHKEHGAGPTQALLAARAGVDPMTTSQVVRALAKRGLLARDDDPEDTRAYRLRPTGDAGRLMKQAGAAVRAADRTFFAPLGGDVERFTTHLRALVRDDGDDA